VSAVLATARLRLRPFTAADVPAVFAMSREAGLRRWLPDQVYRDEAEAADVLAALAAHTAQPPAPHLRPFVLGVEHAATAALIGHVGLSPARGSVEIGYAIGDAWQGQGFAREAVDAMAAWALDPLGLPEVLGIVAADNLASIAVLAKGGFTPVVAPASASALASTHQRVYRRVAAAVS